MFRKDCGFESHPAHQEIVVNIMDLKKISGLILSGIRSIFALLIGYGTFVILNGSFYLVIFFINREVPEMNVWHSYEVPIAFLTTLFSCIAGIALAASTPYRPVLHGVIYGTVVTIISAFIVIFDSHSFLDFSLAWIQCVPGVVLGTYLYRNSRKMIRDHQV